MEQTAEYVLVRGDLANGRPRRLQVFGMVPVPLLGETFGIERRVSLVRLFGPLPCILHETGRLVF